MSENNDTSNESNSRGECILQASRFTGVLRPSVLGSALNSNTVGGNESSGYMKSRDEVASNPFLKDQKDGEEATPVDPEGAVGGEAAPTVDETELLDSKKDDDDEEPDERPDPLTMLHKNGLERANLFAAAKSSIPRVEKSGFIFGQNVHERVVVENKNKGKTAEGNDSIEETGGGAAAAASNTDDGDLLFSSVIRNAAKSNEADGNAAGKETNTATDTKSLNDVAREYEESRAQKRKYEEVETFTGEEHEVNIVDVSCKLFAFINSNWEERGRGSLRLNDSKKEQECSRVVFRTSGNLRLILNTKVWAGMVAERPSQKSLRLTAMDNSGQIKIFLVMGRPADMNQLHKALVERIDLRKASHPEECRADAHGDGEGEHHENGAATKNGNAFRASDRATVVDEVAKAAAVAVPEHDESTEPSPKKTGLSVDN